MALSPMMQHYFQVKEEYPDCIIFYRLGDFYEMFFEDAKTAARELDLALTGRDCGMDERAPMCGMPFHAAEGYLAKLLERGYKVAICEQLTESEKGKMVERGVTRVITPGTVMEESLLEERKNNFVASVYMNKDNSIGLSWVDITTGEFNMLAFDGSDSIERLNDTLSAIAPKEIVANNEMFLNSTNLPVVRMGVVPKFSSFVDGAYAYSKAVASVLEQLKIGSIVVLDAEDKKQGVCSAGALIEYLRQTQKRSLAHINHIQVMHDKNFMHLDVHTRRNLELTETMRDRKTRGSLLWVLDNTFTGMGGRTLRNWIEQPLQNADEIKLRLDSVEELASNTIARQSLVEALHGMRDLERLCGKIGYKNEFLPRNALSLLDALQALPKIKSALKAFSSPLLSQTVKHIADFADIEKLLEKSIRPESPATMRDGGYIKKGYNAELDKLNSASSDGKIWLAQLEQKERELTGIKTLKVGFNSIHGYYIEVSKLQKDLVPFRYTRRQTLINAERYITEELKQMEDSIIGAQDKAIKLEKQLFDEIVTQISARVKELQLASRQVALADALTSFALVSVQNDYVKPEIGKDSSCVLIKDGRHPVIEQIQTNERFVPNDTLIDTDENRVLIITGPNMAGKSTYMRQVALITLMAHCGCFVPASRAEIGITDRIFTRIGASDDLNSGQSTFMVEMVEVANIIRNATNKSLLILDEIGRGTSTFDGLSIAWSVVEHVVEKIKAKALFATHYHELTELEGKMKGVKNFSIAIKELNNTLVFLRKIVRGGANRSFGVEVAGLAGLPETVLARAREILHELEEADINNSNLPIIGKATANKQALASKEMSATSKEIQALNILKELDINKLSPMEAFQIINDIKQKL